MSTHMTGSARFFRSKLQTGSIVLASLCLLAQAACDDPVGPMQGGGPGVESTTNPGDATDGGAQTDADFDLSQRGPYPVGVRTLVIGDEERPLPLEAWYPAEAAQAGRDLDPANWDQFQIAPWAPQLSQAALRDVAGSPGAYPVVLFSHGKWDHRRSASRLMTHIASHGYLVLAIDHTGDTEANMMHDMMFPEEPPQLDPYGSLAERPVDLSRILDRIDWVGAQLGVDLLSHQVAVLGTSLGGWTSMVWQSIDHRAQAVVGLAPPTGGEPFRAVELVEALKKPWLQPTPTLLISGELDVIAPSAGISQLAEELGEHVSFAEMRQCAHAHFGDDPEMRHQSTRQSFEQLGNNEQANFADIAASMAPLDQLASPQSAHEQLAATVLEFIQFHGIVPPTQR